ncbi:MAG TPA: hypothetical protein VFE58_01605 [Tepidisphaeraceae bacterium]|jgi:hypothetical protein|nr:hypothetical protein [Tepidisphaeraceae bacterium]
MLEHEQVMKFAAPSKESRCRLQRYLSTFSIEADVYMTYLGTPLALSGFLISAKNNVDSIIAYCPLTPGIAQGTDEWSEEVSRQLEVAIRVAKEPMMSRRSADVIWLGYSASGSQEIPHWIYALQCLPLTYESAGELISPRPFCPRLFERMASQPQAIHWLARKALPSPQSRGRP